jgi:hypothetical protein
MEYAIGTQTTSRPLYLASFNVQPGSSRAFQRSGAKFFTSRKARSPILQAARQVVRGLPPIWRRAWELAVDSPVEMQTGFWGSCFFVP